MEYSDFYGCMSPWASSYSVPVASYLLFLNITDNLNAVKKGLKYKDDKSEDYYNLDPPQRYQKYANDDLPINSLAHRIYNKLNKDKFISFLEHEASGSVLSDKLFQSFSKKRTEFKKEHIFEIQQNLYNDIADAFVEVIEQADEAYKKSPRNNPRKKTSKTDSKSDEKSAMSIPDKEMQNNTQFDSNNVISTSSQRLSVSKYDRDKIQDLIIEISTIIDSLLNLVSIIEKNEDEIGYNNAVLEFGEMYKQRNDEYKRFIESYYKMHFYDFHDSTIPN